MPWVGVALSCGMGCCCGGMLGCVAVEVVGVSRVGVGGGDVWLWLWVVVVESDVDSDLTFIVHQVDDVVVVVVGGDVVVNAPFPLNDRVCVSTSNEVGVNSIEGV